MKKRGSIDRIDNGRFRLRMSIAGKQETIGFYDTEEEAERARDVAADVAADAQADYEGLTLEELGRKVLTRREVAKRVRDPQSDWSRWNQHVKPDVIARLAVKRIRTEHLHRWLGRLEDKRLAPQTRRNCLNLVRVVLREALLEGVIKTNPSDGLRVAGKTESWTYLHPREQMVLLEALGEAERHIVAVAMGTGLRAGELVTLRLADVFLDDKSPRLIVRFGKAPAHPTKTGKPRSVPLFGVALAALRSWLVVLPSYAPKNPHGLVFPRERGGFRSEEHVILWGSWRAGQDAVGRRFRWHDLRHTCASSLVSGWWGRRWSIQEVKEVLGHTSILITQRYAHLAEGALADAARETAGVSASQLPSGSGDPGETRTPAILFRKQVLYPAELPGHESKELGKPCFSREQAQIASTDTELTGDISGELPPGYTGTRAEVDGLCATVLVEPGDRPRDINARLAKAVRVLCKRAAGGAT